MIRTAPMFPGRTALLALSLVLLAACSKPERVTPDAGAPAVASDEPLEYEGFPNANDGQKLIMSSWGKIVVVAEYQDEDSGLPTPAGMTADASYVRKIDDLPVGKFSISHKETPGTNTPDPVIADLGDKSVVAAACPASLGANAVAAGEVGTKEFVKGIFARYRCAKLSFGSGIVATFRKDERVYEMMCVATGETALTDCLAIVQQYRPS